MTHCSVYNHDVEPAAPSELYWGMIGAFWSASLILGVVAAMTSGWTFLSVGRWPPLATSGGVLAQRATAWSCSECGAMVAPPFPSTAPVSGFVSASHGRW